MLISLMARERTDFDCFLAFYNAHVNVRGLMCWQQVSPCTSAKQASCWRVSFARNACRSVEQRRLLEVHTCSTAWERNLCRLVYGCTMAPALRCRYITELRAESA